ncbi:MAG: corrinoid protein [Synergistaceae bacterium]|nr:corrinoid protein [Synergistaceae bacterium]
MMDDNMTDDAENIFARLSNAVVGMDEDTTVELAREALDQNVDAYEAIDRGLSDGMRRAGDLFENEEYFVPELLMCSDAMYAGLNILQPHIRRSGAGVRRRIVIGVVEGDTHDIGKNLVKIMLEAAGFDVLDLGRDIPPDLFIDEALKNEADVIALSTLMTTTLPGMRKVVDLLNARNIRERFKVMVGGGPVSKAYADKIGADGYAGNATEAVKLAGNLCGAPVVK